MNDRLYNLARQMLDDPRFEWEEGMSNVLGWRRVCCAVSNWIDDMGNLNNSQPIDGSGLESPPDLDDAATTGVILSWLGPCDAMFTPTPKMWSVAMAYDGWDGLYDGEYLGEAVAKAWLATCPKEER